MKYINAHLCQIIHKLGKLRIATLVCAAIVSQGVVAQDLYRSTLYPTSVSPYSLTNTRLMLAQSDIPPAPDFLDPAPAPSEPEPEPEQVEQEVLGEFANEFAANDLIQSLPPLEQQTVEIITSEKEILRVYMGPYQTEEEAREQASKIDTSILQYRMGYVESLAGYIVSFGQFENDENLQNFYTVMSSFGIEDIKSISTMQKVYQVVRKPKPKPVVVPPDEQTGTVEGLSFESMFFDDVPEFSDSDEEELEEPSNWFARLDWNGYLKNETAYRYHEPRSITKIRNILYLSTQEAVHDNVDVFFAGWYYYDLAYDLFNYDTITARSERNAEEPLVFVERLDEEKDSNIAELRELYADIFFEGMDIRIGKQFIIWGVLEGIRVVDEINPMDFRELILPDLLDYRISLWSLKLDYFGENTDYQLVWIPDLRFHKPAPRGSEWEMLQNVCKGQAEEILCEIKEPDSWTLKDSEIGFRISKVLWDTEMTFSYLYTWDDFPVIFRAVRVDTTQVPPAFFPTYTRIQMYGMTAVKQVDTYILKGEFSFVTGKYFGIKNSEDANGDGYVDFDGVLKRQHIRWAMGLEFNVGGFDIAPGVSQWVIFGHEDAMMQAKYDTSYNLFLRKELPERAAVFQMLTIYLKSLDELLIKPKVTFQLDDKLQLGVGLDLFYGRKSDFGSNQAARTSTGTFDPGFARAQFVGNFHDNDRLYFELKYSF